MAVYTPIKGQEEDNGDRNKSLKSNDEGGHVDDDEAVDENKSFILPTHSRQQDDVQRQKQQRLVSLDVFRGLTVAVMFPVTFSIFIFDNFLQLLLFLL
jgi:heparan-alpha-glucosaminide N-acetyltransferase